MFVFLYLTFTLFLFFSFFFFFFNDTATTEIYTLSLHDALPICIAPPAPSFFAARTCRPSLVTRFSRPGSEEHTSELQSHSDLVCRLLLEKKKTAGADWRRANTPPPHQPTQTP